MLKKFIISIFSFIAINNVYAITCPSAAEIRQQVFHQWQVYDSDNGTPLSAEDLKDFANDTTQFLMAEWAENAPEGSSHCYYGDNTGRYMNAYLAQHHLRPDFSHGKWRNWDGFKRCFGAMEQCGFVPGA